MDILKPLGQTPGTSMDIPLDQLGAPGVQGEIIIKAMFTDRNNDDPIRFSDRSTREFEIGARLAKAAPSNYELNGAIEANQGSSFILASDDTTYFFIDFPTGKLKITVNDNHEMAIATATIFACTHTEARFIFLDMLNTFFDRMAYLTGAPTHISFTVARDVRHEVQYMSYISPPRSQHILSSGESLSI